MDSVRILSAIMLLSFTGFAHAAEKPDRSPVALAVSEDGKYCLTANHTGGSVSLVDLTKGEVVNELAIGNGPADIAWIDGKTAIVSLLHDDQIAVVSQTGESLTLDRKSVV